MDFVLEFTGDDEEGPFSPVQGSQAEEQGHEKYSHVIHVVLVPFKVAGRTLEVVSTFVTKDVFCPVNGGVKWGGSLVFDQGLQFSGKDKGQCNLR